MRHLWRFMVLMALLGALPQSAVAQLVDEADFDPVGQDWNGLADFVALAEEQGMKIDAVDRLDYGKLQRDDVVVIVHPIDAIDVKALADFIVDGGRVLLADDFGASGTLLDRLDLTRMQVEMGSLPHRRFVGGNPALPVFTPRGEHPLLVGVERAAGNHPAVLSNVGGPVLSYDEGGGVIYDMNLGEGKVVVYADASMLINHMLAVADNKQLVANTIRYLCEGRVPCQAALVTAEFEQSGGYEAREETARAAWADRIDEVNETIVRAMAQIPATQLIYYLSILLAGALSLYLAAALPVRSGHPYSELIAGNGADKAKPQGEFDWNLSRFGGGQKDTNYALPLAILKEIFEEIFLRKIGRWERRQGADISELAADYRGRFLSDVPDREARAVERELLELLATYAQLPTRHRIFLDSDAYVSERELLRIHRKTREVLRRMGLEEEYERRTRSLG